MFHVQQLFTAVFVLSAQEGSHLPPGESFYGHTRVSRVLYVTMMWRFGQNIEEINSRKVTIGDFEHILGQCLCGTLSQSEISDVKRDMERDDVNRHPNIVNVSDPVGGVENEGVVHFVWLHLHILDVPAVNVLLGKCLDRQLFGSDVALLGFYKTPEKAVRWGGPDCKRNLRWQVVFMCDLQRTENIQW